MSLEIPLLRESKQFADRLFESCRVFGDSVSRLRSRANWTYRYSQAFYEVEREIYVADPDRYLRQESLPRPSVEDIFALRITGRKLADVLMKVAVHWAFFAMGMFFRSRAKDFPIHRRAYVEDIELVFDPSQLGVMRFVYPFPLKLRRQLKYLRALRSNGVPFRLHGHPYSPRDLLRVLRRRTVGELERMERRAQVRMAGRLLREGYREFQVSDEFNLGSLYFARRLRRAGVPVINSAHGSGKYLPVHAYSEFRHLTGRQREYYRAVLPCTYKSYALNDVSTPTAAATVAPGGGPVHLVFLSQRIGTPTQDLYAQYEIDALESLRARFARSDAVSLLYKPHPNALVQREIPDFRVISSVAEFNGQPGTIYVSFSSTCFCDPTFKGENFLLRQGVLRPEILYDDSRHLVSMDEFIACVEAMISSLLPVTPRPLHENPVDECGTHA